MAYEKNMANVINKFGVSQRILDKETKLFEFFIMGTYYPPNKPFYIVDEEERYQGTFYAPFLSKLDSELLITNPSMEQLLNVARDERAYRHDETKSEMENLQVVLGVFKQNMTIQPNGDSASSLIELPIIDGDGKLIAIMDIVKLMALLEPPEHRADAPLLRYSYDKTFAEYKDNLNAYGKNVFTHHGEDGIIETIFDLIGTSNKYAIEFGGWDGIVASNIRNLLLNHDWSGLFIEGDPLRSQQCRMNYEGNSKVTSVVGFVNFLTGKNLDQYLLESNVPREPDLLSIDIDGYDYHVWESLANYSPRVVIIERHIMMSNDIFFVNPRCEDVLIGSSASALVALGHIKGYELVAVTMANCIFVRNDEYAKIGLADNSLDTLWRENLYSSGRSFYMNYHSKQYMNVSQWPTIWWGEGPK